MSRFEAIRRTALYVAVSRLVRNLDRHDAVRAANAMAFDAFLSLIPLLAMAGWALSLLHQKGELLEPLLRGAPLPVIRLAGSEFLRLSDGSLATLAPISAVGFLWVSSSGLSTAMGVFETVFLAEPRPWYVRRAIAAACVIGGLAVLSGVLTATYAMASALGPAAAAILAGVAPTLLLLGGVAFFFRIAVRRPRGMRRRLLPGGVVTVALWAAASAGFSYYVARFARYATFYGSLATVAIVLFWLWLLSLALLVGGEVNAQLEGVRDPTWSSTPMPVAR